MTTKYEEPEDDGDDGYCGACAGTGEGQYDGAVCSCCKGKGYLPRHEDADDFNEPDPEDFEPWAGPN